MRYKSTLNKAYLFLTLLLILSGKVYPGFAGELTAGPEPENEALFPIQAAAGCAPYSTLPCENLRVSLPYSLVFDTPVANSIADKAGSGTGFKVVMPYSGARSKADLPVTNSSLYGYEPSRISLSGGRLRIQAGKGLDFQSDNNQINTLTVQMPSATKLQLEVKLVSPYKGTKSEQAGLWIGLSDKTYVKLDINNSKVELRKETNDVTSASTSLANPDQRVTAEVAGMSTKTIRLRMVLDFSAGTAEGFYSMDGVNYTSTGTRYTNSKLDISQMGLTSENTYAGIFSSYRSGTPPITFSFDDFLISDLSPAPTFRNVSVNFRPTGSAAPSGFVADNGLSFNASRGYGWVSPSTGAPIDMQASMRLRTGTDRPEQLSFVQTQSSSSGQKPGSWEYVVPNGRYTVTVSAGDNGFYDSNHQINVEGLPTVSDFNASAQNKFRTGVATVQVSDGKLTISSTGGTNTKMNYVSIRRAGLVLDLMPPQVSARLSGTVQSGTVYSGNVKVFMSAQETGAGLTIFQYSINNGTYIDYKEPFTLTEPGEYSVRVRGMDANMMQSISQPYTFTIAPPVAPKIVFNKERLSFTVLRGNAVQAQTVGVVATPPVSYTLSKSEASWLTLPAASANLTFGPQQINTNIAPGRYQTHVMASANGYDAGDLVIDLQVIEPLSTSPVNINFQDAATVPPAGYLRDFGQAFAQRMDANQSVGLTYGWKQRSNGVPVDLSGNGRRRAAPQDVLMATLMHMQADDITTNFQGNKTEGYWEMKVPNGSYDVTVTVGDGLVNSAPEVHNINVEGISAISNFKPVGKQGTISRFSTATVNVNVTDGLLTINADGGTNTKITHANIIPVSLAPYVYWSAKTVNLIVDKTATDAKVLTVALGRSDNASSTFNVSATYGSGASNWLTFSSSVSGLQPMVALNYTAIRNLPLGVYKATVRATSGSLTAAEFNIQVNVVDGAKPYVISSNPANGATNVSLSTNFAAANNLSIPSIEGTSGVDNTTIDTTSVFLYKVVNGQETLVPGSAQGSVGGDVISKTAKFGLEPNSTYRFVVTSKVKSSLGDGFAPYEATFTTAAPPVDSSLLLNAQFQKVVLPLTQNKKYTSLAIGPDDKLYALRSTGVIDRYTINHSTGQLSGMQTINTLFTKYGERMAIGLVFDPSATAGNLIIWVSHSKGVVTNGPEFDGNLSKLSGANLDNEQLILTRMPRSTKDHLINGLAFGPDGALYICQGSMNSAGVKDPDWQRDETLLSASVLRLDPSKLTSLPLNVQTTSDQALINAAPANSITFSDGTYNPYATNAPLKIYASGVRNAYDLLWHTNGQLYVPTNGSGGQGNTPASVPGTRKVNGTTYNGPVIPPTVGVQAQVDWLFRINPSKPVGYFGHPNPLRGEYVINRGYQDDSLYLPSVKADANFRAGYDFGGNNSPNGVIEYKSNTFNGVLKNKLMVVRFSGGGDIAVMEPGSKVKTGNASDDAIYDVVKVNTGSSNTGLVGMSGFANPLDLVEDVVNGNIYVAEYNWNDVATLIPQITLLKVVGASPPPVLGLTATARTSAEESQARRFDVALSNDGDGVLEIKEIKLATSEAGALSMEDIALPSERATLKIPKDSIVNFQVLAAQRLGRSGKGRLIVTTIDNTVKEIEINGVDAAELLRAASLDDNRTDHSMTVFPNPTMGNPVNIQLEKFNVQEPVTIYLYDLKGNVVKTVSGATDDRGELSLQLIDKSRKPGTYIVKVVYISGYKFAKIVHAE